jgi:hypothetical protein
MAGDLERALAEALAALEVQPRDAAAAELARELAAEIDQAEVAERVADKALRMAAEEDREDLEELIRALRTRAGHRDAIVRCGQRLESLLIQLGATPAARGKAGGSVTPVAGGPLALLRGGAAG